MKMSASIHHLSEARVRRFGPERPSDSESAKLYLTNVRDFAEAALTLVELSGPDAEAWSRDAWDELSTEAKRAFDLLGEFASTSYRDALDIIEHELQLLLSDAPPPRPDPGAHGNGG